MKRYALYAYEQRRYDGFAGVHSAFRKGDNMPQTHAHTHTLSLPQTDKKLSVAVELVPADTTHSLLDEHPNVARVNIGGKEFLAVVGKTTITD